MSQFTIIVKCIKNNMFKCINRHGLRPGDGTKAIQTAGRQPPSIRPIFGVLIFLIKYMIEVLKYYTLMNK